LQEKGINIASHISSIGNVQDKAFDPVSPDPELMKRLSTSTFALIDESCESKMRDVVEEARMSQDSVGGTVECIVTGLPVGIGGPLFDGIEGEIAKAMFGIPAVKGIEFGKGFESSKLKGSENNDAFEYKESKVVTKTNNCGGILGGISNGMPVVFKVAFKPTPSISKEQDTVNLQTKENAKLIVKGRHDPCIVPRAVSVVEAMTAVAIFDLL
jgi:chorismate synthase